MAGCVHRRLGGLYCARDVNGQRSPRSSTGTVDGVF